VRRPHDGRGRAVRTRPARTAQDRRRRCRHHRRAGPASSRSSESARMTSAPTSTGVLLPRRRWLLDLSATAVLAVVALVGFWPSFAGPSFLGAALGGVLLGLAVAAVCTWRRWGILVRSEERRGGT